MNLSVVVPIFNSEKYLSKCLESILAQSIPDMEVICVDDGSGDGSLEILKKYQKMDFRIKVIHLEHVGLVAARKAGVKEAKGKYIGYVDSDDWIEPDMYRTLISLAEKYDADLITSGTVFEKGFPMICFDGFSEGLYTGEKLEYLQQHTLYNENCAIGVRPNLTNKLFCAELIKKVQLDVPDDITNGEDRICTMLSVLQAKSVYILKKAFYHYVYYPKSMSNQQDEYYLDKLGKVYRCFKSNYMHPKFSAALRTQCEIYIVQYAVRAVNEHLGFSIPNMMWIDPEWIREIPCNSKVVLYGAGSLGKTYYQQIVSNKNRGIVITGWVDCNYMELQNYPMIIQNPELITTLEFDYIILAVIDEATAEQIRESLFCKYKLSYNQIIWIQQEEMIWKYMKAIGLFS